MWLAKLLMYLGLLVFILLEEGWQAAWQEVRMTKISDFDNS